MSADSAAGRRARAAASMAIAVVLALAAVGSAGTTRGLAAGLVDPGPAIKVNQLGYVVGASKRASVVSSSTSPLAWSLVDAGNAVVATGTTTVKGVDANSGDSIHLVDLSSFDRPGTGYALRVG